MPGYQWDVSDPVACVEVIFGNVRTSVPARPPAPAPSRNSGGWRRAEGSVWTARRRLARLVQGARDHGYRHLGSLRCELLPKAQEPFVIGSAELDPLLEMADWLVACVGQRVLRAVERDLAAMFAQNWPADYTRLKAELPAWTLFYVVAGYDYFPKSA